jgi:CRISPR-associated protein Csb1
MVPHQRLEFTARTITAYVAVDHDQIRSYGLGTSGTELLEALVAFELSNLFRGGPLRLRTACDLEVVEGAVDPLAGIPEPTDAAERVAVAIKAAGDLLGHVTEVVWARATSGTKAKA